LRSRCAPALAALAFTLFSCGQQEKPLNILIIGVDTLRPDHLSCYGYERATSPNIDRLAAEGVVFENVVSQCPWTLPSFATVLTSLYPSQHGAGINMSTMRTSFPTLAEILRENGFATGAVVNVSVLSPEFGVARGFDHYDAEEPGVKRKADEVTKLALDWIDTSRDNPFFAFVHYFDPHLSYCPPAPFDTLFDPTYSGRIGRCFDRETYLELKPVLLDRKDDRTDADWDHIRALYDGEIAFTDLAVGELLAGLADRGLASTTLIVFLADHGEEFAEHGGYGHGHTLFREVIDVPLIMRLPGRLAEGVRLKRQVRLLDVTPTVLDLLGIETRAQFEGVSLVPLLEGTGQPERSAGVLYPPEAAFAEGLQRGTERKSVSAYPWKYIYNIATGEQVLFDLGADPGETVNVIGENRDVSELLRGMLFKSLLSMSDTWYVEIAAGGVERRIDMRIEAERGAGRGRIYFHEFFDAEGRPVEAGDAAGTNDVRSVLEVRDLTVDGTIVLAFQAHAPAGIPLTFDMRIDGEPALESTFVGESLKCPTQMPFSKRARGADGGSSAGPWPRPEPPYLLVWHTAAVYGGNTPAALKSETIRDLRALGYIQ
jgi:arylsulfatase A-like enzyme